MITSDELKKIQEYIEDFFQKMTIEAKIDVQIPSLKISDVPEEKVSLGERKQDNIEDSLELNIKIDDPQILIGEKGQTLNEIQRILKGALSKKIGKNFYFNLDINDYKKKKIEYLKNLARDLADEVVLSKEPKVLNPMSSYERRIIHTELSSRTDVQTKSEGDEPRRRVVIKPR